MHVFSALVATTCTAGFVFINSLSLFWIDAYQAQLTVTNELKQNIASIEPGSTVFFDNVCPHIGPASVIEAEWDAKGSLQLAFNDKTLRGDVISSKLEISEDGFKTRIYELNYSYPYEKLHIFNYESKTLHLINSKSSAMDYFQNTESTSITACPESTEGMGVTLISSRNFSLSSLSLKNFNHTIATIF